MPIFLRDGTIFSRKSHILFLGDVFAIFSSKKNIMLKFTKTECRKLYHNW